MPERYQPQHTYTRVEVERPPNDPLHVQLGNSCSSQSGGDCGDGGYCGHHELFDVVAKGKYYIMLMGQRVGKLK